MIRHYSRKISKSINAFGISFITTNLDVPGYTGTAISAQLNAPAGIAIDALGSIYIIEQSNNTILKVDKYGIMTTIAGIGKLYMNDDLSDDDEGLATSAQLSSPKGIAIDASGNVYIADTRNNKIRKVDTLGSITTIAGNGSAGYNGDGTLATSAQLHYPSGIAIDSSGNVYIADTWNNRIRKVDKSGIITTIAGNGTRGYRGDGTSATLAELDLPEGVAVDTFGNVYIADTVNGMVRKVAPSGIITTIAGNSTEEDDSREGVKATSVQLSPESVAVDTYGNVFVYDSFNCTVRKVDKLGIISTIAGNGICGYNGDGGKAIFAQLSSVEGIALDNYGNVYIADEGNKRIRKVDIAGKITTIIGNGTVSYSRDNCAATSAQLDWPTGIAVDVSGNVYIADRGSDRVRKVSTSGIITTIAGNGTRGYNGDGIEGLSAQLYCPVGVAVDVFGNVYIADSFNARIRKVNSSGIITTIAGNGISGYSGDGGLATSAQLNHPDGLAVDASGNVYIVEAFNKRIRKVDTSGIITTIAGNGSWGYNGDGRLATSAQLDCPKGVVVDTFGNVYIADTLSNRIRKVDTSGIINTIAGNGTRGYSGDGISATLAELDTPKSIAVDVYGNVYIVDTNYQRIRKVHTNGIITTISGNGIGGYSGDGGLATSAQVCRPEGITVDASGNVYFVDSGNRRVRKIDTSGIITTIAGNGKFGY